MRWRQGEHVTLIGPTGCGKTTLGLSLLPMRAGNGGHVAAVATKPKDPSLQALTREGYRVVRTWPPPDHEHRVVFWPSISRMSDKRAQQSAIFAMLADVYNRGGFCLYFDELRYITQTLRLTAPVEQLLMQGRSIGISVVSNAQRPASIPLLAYDQATHLFVWRESDEVNLKRLGGLGGLDSGLIRQTVARLPKHQVLYINTRDGLMARTTCPKRK